jgi:hypothetical protein
MRLKGFLKPFKGLKAFKRPLKVFTRPLKAVKRLFRFKGLLINGFLKDLGHPVGAFEGH